MPPELPGITLRTEKPLKRAPGGPIHYAPIGDSQEHAFDAPCPCRPERVQHETHTVLVHNWFDARQARIEAARTGQQRASLNRQQAAMGQRGRERHLRASG